MYLLNRFVFYRSMWLFWQLILGLYWDGISQNKYWKRPVHICGIKLCRISMKNCRCTITIKFLWILIKIIFHTNSNYLRFKDFTIKILYGVVFNPPPPPLFWATLVFQNNFFFLLLTEIRTSYTLYSANVRSARFNGKILLRYMLNATELQRTLPLTPAT